MNFESELFRRLDAKSQRAAQQLVDSLGEGGFVDETVAIARFLEPWGPVKVDPTKADAEWAKAFKKATASPRT